MNFGEFHAAYEDIVRRARDGKLTATTSPAYHDLADQPGRHRHGALGAAPDERAGRDHRRRRAWSTPPSSRAASDERSPRLGVGKLMTLTSTYDHRIIQGAEIGRLPAHGARAAARRRGSTTRSSRRSRIPYEPIRWRGTSREGASTRTRGCWN
jgi:2-oxoglutarate decarboxylase